MLTTLGLTNYEHKFNASKAQASKLLLEFQNYLTHEIIMYASLNNFHKQTTYSSHLLENGKFYPMSCSFKTDPQLLCTHVQGWCMLRTVYSDFGLEKYSGCYCN